MGFNPKLRLLEHPNEEMRKKARKSLALVGLGEKENENYTSLSEGQKQLCILARTLVSEANLLLLDEPESALDFRFRYKMLEILRSWVSCENRGAIVTLHDGALALNYCDELLRDYIQGIHTNTVGLPFATPYEEEYTDDYGIYEEYMLYSAEKGE